MIIILHQINNYLFLNFDNQPNIHFIQTEITIFTFPKVIFQNNFPLLDLLKIMFGTIVLSY